MSRVHLKDGIRLLISMAKHDVLRVARDRFLVGSVAYVIVVSVAVRFGLPWLRARTLVEGSFDLADYQHLIASYVAVMIGAMLSGVVGAFLILEAREEHTIDAVAVSPVPIWRFLAGEAGLIYLVSVTVSGFAALVLKHGLPPAGPLAVILLVAGLVAPAVGLAVPSFARDKVQAFALLKLVGLLGFLPVAAWFVPEPWQGLAVPLPGYGALRAWWMAASGETGWGTWLLLGCLVNGVWVSAAIIRFQRVVRPS